MALTFDPPVPTVECDKAPKDTTINSLTVRSLGLKDFLCIDLLLESF